MTETPDTGAEAPQSAAAKLFDLRLLIGGLFVVYGVMLTVAGFFTSSTDLAKASHININLWMGIGMLVLGVFFPVVAAQPAPASPSRTSRSRTRPGPAGDRPGPLRDRRRGGRLDRQPGRRALGRRARQADRRGTAGGGHLALAELRHPGAARRRPRGRHRAHAAGGDRRDPRGVPRGADRRARRRGPAPAPRCCPRPTTPACWSSAPEGARPSPACCSARWPSTACATAPAPWSSSGRRSARPPARERGKAPSVRVNKFSRTDRGSCPATIRAPRRGGISRWARRSPVA